MGSQQSGTAHRKGASAFLTLPVETDPDIVCQAVSGLLGGFVELSALNVEALLVLANSVGVCPASPSQYNLFRSNHKVLTRTHL